MPLTLRLKKCAGAPSGTEPCWELADPTMTDIPEAFLRETTNLTGTLKLGAAVKTIGRAAFYKTKLTGLGLSAAASLVSIGDFAFRETNLEGTLAIPAKVDTIGAFALFTTDITGLSLSKAASVGLNRSGLLSFRFGLGSAPLQRGRFPLQPSRPADQKHPATSHHKRITSAKPTSLKACRASQPCSVPDPRVPWSPDSTHVTQGR